MKAQDKLDAALAAAEDAHARAAARTVETRTALEAAERAAADAEERWTADETPEGWREVEDAKRERDKLRLRLRRIEAEERDAAATVATAQREADVAALAQANEDASEDRLTAARDGFLARALALEAEAARFLDDMVRAADAGARAKERAASLAVKLGVPHAGLPWWDVRVFLMTCRKAIALRHRIEDREQSLDAEVTPRSALTPLPFLDGRWTDAERDDAIAEVVRARHAAAAEGE